MVAGAVTHADTLPLPTLRVDHDDQGEHQPWRSHARSWFERSVDGPAAARLPVIEVDGVVVSAAVGRLEPGVLNPFCPRGRTVRLANVITLPEHRGNGHAPLLVRDVVDWARAVEADRVDLSATPEGRRSTRTPASP